MPLIGSILASNGSLTLMNAERLLVGISPSQFARFARPGGVEVQSNHPAWIMGHLALYPQRVLLALGLPLGDSAMPSGYEPLFKNGSECRDDAAGSLYPPMAELSAAFFRSYKAAIAAVASAADEAFAKPNPAEGRLRELFPTIGAAVAFYLSGHAQLHLGQLSAWRRAMGLGAAM